MTKTRVSLAPSFQPVKAPGTEVSGADLLDPKGAKVILGWSQDAFAASIAPSPSTLFGPRGVCLHPDGSVWVSDTGHHRLLGWKTAPLVDNQPADFIIGQPDFSSEGRNAKKSPDATTMNVPTGLCVWGEGLALADPWNHRVLLWKKTPTSSNQPADIILGQSDEFGVLANRGADAPTAETLHWPYGVMQIDGKLIVCDTGNRRALFWDNPKSNGEAATMVLGQEDFITRDENAGSEVSAMSMRWPHQIAFWKDHFAICDAGNNRIMLWKGMPTKNGQPCDAVLGQADMTSCDHNMSNYYPTPAAVNMPYAMASHGDMLLIGDTANSRMLGWQDPTMGSNAKALSAQPDFAAKGDNRWVDAVRDSVCWPYGMSILGDTVAIADSGNNRILIWDIVS